LKKEEKQGKEPESFKDGCLGCLTLLVLLGIVAFLLTSCFDDEDESNSALQEIPENIVQYHIVNVEDLSFGNTSRYKYNIVIDEEATIKQLKDLSKVIVDKASKEHNFNAISIVFNDYDEFVDKGSSLGLVDFAPEGDWSKSDTVNAGEYKKMGFAYDLKKKDWSQRPSKEEVQIYAEWKKARNANQDLEDIEVSKIVSQKLNIDANKIEEIITKVMLLWM
jgi:hypothetical protein